MRTILYWSLILVVLVTYTTASKCKTFTCGDFDHKKEDICVLVPEGSPHELVRACDEGKTCNGTRWHVPDQAVHNAIWQIPDSLLVNKTLPGDYCTETSECFGIPGEVNCHKGVCRTTRKEGDYCDNVKGPLWPLVLGSAWCDVGLYCHTGIKQCLKQKTQGDVCNYFTQCAFGYGWVLKVAEDINVWHKYWSFEEGDQFDTYNFEPIKGLFDYGVLCKTGYAYETSRNRIYECRKPPVSLNVEKEKDLKRSEGDGQLCKFISYNDPTNKDLPVEYSDYSQCGFNKDEAGYCKKRKGDKWYQKVIAKVQAQDIWSIKCNPQSLDFNCDNLHKGLTEKIFSELVRENLAIDQYIGWANYANNDKCVAKSITANYWRGESPSLNLKDLLGA